MKALFRGALVYSNGKFNKQDMLFDGTTLSIFADTVCSSDFTVFDNVVIIPGFCDVHVHFREPGFSYKETIRTGTMAAARGGYTAVCTMPNLNPVPDSKENLEAQLKIINESAVVDVYPYGAITKLECGMELADMEDMADSVVAFSDDGKGIQSEEMMLSAMQKAKALGKMIVAHCEDNSLLFGGYIHDGEYAKAHGHRGICSESEYKQIERDLILAEKAGCPYHVCHISTKESVELIRQAKSRGVDVSCETAPHYLTLDEGCLCEDARFKMNPPLRSKEDRLALINGVLDGTVDMIATDHAPHSKEEKSLGLEKSPMGVVGLETAFAVLYTYLVKPGTVSLEKIVELLTANPRKRFKIAGDCGFTVFDLSKEYKINPDEFLSMGKSTPYLDMSVYGRCLLTVKDGKVLYTDKTLNDN